MRLRSPPMASSPHRGALVHARAARSAARVRAGPPCHLPAPARRPPVCSTISPRGTSRGRRPARDAAHAAVQDAVASLVGVRRHTLPPRPRAAAPPASAASAANRVRPPFPRPSTQAARRCAPWGPSAPAPTSQCRAERPSAAGGARRATLCPSPSPPPRSRGRRWRATTRTCCGCARCWRCSRPRRAEASGGPCPFPGAVALHWGWDTNAIAGNVDPHCNLKSACAWSSGPVFSSSPCGLTFRADEGVLLYSTRSVSTR